jgi:hypothetical protein
MFQMFQNMSKTKIALIVGGCLLVLAVLLYVLLDNGSGKMKFSALGLKFSLPHPFSKLATPAAASDPCYYLVEGIPDAGYAQQVNTACQSYQKKCGVGSTANEVLFLSNNTEPDPNIPNNTLQVLSNDLDVPCKTPMSCADGDPCPEFLKCVSGLCQ